MVNKFKIFIVITLFCFSYIFSANYNLQPTKFNFPIKNEYVITSMYGNRILFDRPSFHNGIDLAAPIGTEVYASLGGFISYIGFNDSYGNYIIMTHSNGYKSLYGHLSSEEFVTLGSTVYGGQVIGCIGPVILTDGKRNGVTTGPHLHFSIYGNNRDTVDPLTMLR